MSLRGIIICVSARVVPDCISAIPLVGGWRAWGGECEGTKDDIEGQHAARTSLLRRRHRVDRLIVADVSLIGTMVFAVVVAWCGLVGGRCD